MQAMILSHKGCTSRCQSTELHEDLIVVADFKSSQLVMCRWFFTWTNISIRTNDLLHPSTVRWHSSDCRQLHFEPSSARLFSSPSLSIVWSNYQNYIHRLLWSLLSFLRGEWMFDHGYCPLTQASTRQKKASY